MRIDASNRAARYLWQEFKERGVRDSMFRLIWPWVSRLNHRKFHRGWPYHSKISDARDRIIALSRSFGIQPECSEQWCDANLDALSRQKLLDRAQGVVEGRWRLFSDRVHDIGTPPDWQWDAWTQKPLGDAPEQDIKCVWELGRFPQAFDLMRGYVVGNQEQRQHYAQTFEMHWNHFWESQKCTGVHWRSGQEIVLRAVACLMASHTMSSHLLDTVYQRLADHIWAMGHYLKAEIPYSQFSVSNNHLISEATGLLMAGLIFNERAKGKEWYALGARLLVQAVDEQFFDDGTYVQQSPTYHRLAMCMAYFGSRLLEIGSERTRIESKLKKSIRHLYALQCAHSGRLPNFGSNDGAQALILSEVEYPDFRSHLQWLSCLLEGHRLYEPGLWDEQSAWFGHGGEQTKALNISSRFDASGYYIASLQPKARYGVLRCGKVGIRYGQMDMMHVDLWWDGINLASDGGSYLYNGPQQWHRHFISATSHNTLTLNDEDPMVHHRRFVNLFWSRCQIVTAIRQPGIHGWVGEHDAYLKRYGVLHRRRLLYVENAGFQITDWLIGEQTQALKIRLHWLLPADAWTDRVPSPTVSASETSLLRCEAAELGLHYRCSDSQAEVDVAIGQVNPPRGWLSRYYGRKEPAYSWVSRSQTQSHGVDHEHVRWWHQTWIGRSEEMTKMNELWPPE